VTKDQEVIFVSKEQIDNRLGDSIKTARQAKGWTQVLLAETLKISPRYLKAIENSGRKPSYDLLNRIFSTLDIPTDAVFHPESKRPPAKLYILQGSRKPG
jgi:transcriptional regulator with XRE-family HTH domain